MLFSKEQLLALGILFKDLQRMCGEDSIGVVMKTGAFHLLENDGGAVVRVISQNG